MLRKIISGVLAIMVVVSTMLCTGCGSSAVNTAGAITNITQLYQYVATCEGDDLHKDHANKVTFIKSTGDSSNRLYFTDFYVDYAGLVYPIKSLYLSTWDKKPEKGVTTEIKNVGYIMPGAGTKVVSFSAHWFELAKVNSGFNKYEGKARLNLIQS